MILIFWLVLNSIKTVAGTVLACLGWERLIIAFHLSLIVNTKTPWYNEERFNQGKY